jgi:flagella basal body P-ring formation protein FlgA
MTLSLLVLAAAAFADLDAIDRQVAQFAGASATPVDRRLRLQPCRSGLALSWRTAAQDSVVVQCGDPAGWRLFVPVRGGAAAPGGPLAVTRGDAVSIAVAGEGFTVSQPGEALESGAVGSWIRVRPAAVPGKLARAEAMRARVERPGLVSVPLP